MLVKAFDLTNEEIKKALTSSYITVDGYHGSIEFIATAPHDPPQLSRQCEYCGSICLGDHPRCESCGAPRAYI